MCFSQTLMKIHIKKIKLCNINLRNQQSQLSLKEINSNGTLEIVQKSKSKYSEDYKYLKDFFIQTV